MPRIASLAKGKRLAIVFELVWCVYSQKMHETVLSDPDVVDYLNEHFVVVQYNLDKSICADCQFLSVLIFCRLLRFCCCHSFSSA